MVELSIIIVNFNTPDLVFECVKSVKRNTKKTGYEIIIVDNGSEKDIKISGYEDIRVIRNKENLGFAKANNQGIKIAKGEYVLLLNSDTVVKDNAIDKLLEFARETPDAGVVAPKLLNIDGLTQDSVFHFPTIINAIREFWFGEKGLFGLYVPKTAESIEVDAVVGAAFLITPQAIKKVGLLDERYFFYYEDLDYCRKIRNAGLKVYYVPDVEIIHLKGASGKGLVESDKQWNRLTPSSKIYNGVVGHYVLFWVIKIGQKIRGK